MRRLPLGVFFIAAGILHFVRPAMYEAIVPEALPAPREIVYVSGAAEIAGGAAVLAPRAARAAGWWLIALLVAVFPANVDMALKAERFPHIPAPLLWLRLPLQGLLIVWVWRVAAAPSPPRGARGWRRPRRGRPAFAVRRSP